MDLDVENLVRNCADCQTSDKVLTQRMAMAPLQPVQLPDRCWSKLGIDVVGTIEGAPGSSRFAITMIDYRSKWPEARLVPKATTTDIISFLNSVWSREGYLDEIVSDNGPQFTSKEFSEYLWQRDITYTYSSTCWPRGNGAIEWFNCTFKMWVCGLQPGVPLRDRVCTRLAYYRATPHCTTGVSPAVMLY